MHSRAWIEISTDIFEMRGVAVTLIMAIHGFHNIFSFWIYFCCLDRAPSRDFQVSYLTYGRRLDVPLEEGDLIETLYSRVR